MLRWGDYLGIYSGASKVITSKREAGRSLRDVMTEAEVREALRCYSAGSKTQEGVVSQGIDIVSRS